MAASPLITGATGFAGSHLLDLLLNDHAAVHAWFNPRGRTPSHASDRVRWQAVDLLDAAAAAGFAGRVLVTGSALV